MEIVTAIVTPVVESLMVPVKKHLGYLISCTKYVRDMGTKRKDLDDKRVNVEEHKNHNERSICVVPTKVDGWLKKVQKLEEKAANISGNVGSCFNITLRHKLGRKAFKIIEEIDCLIQENDMINWTNHRIPIGKVNSNKASTSTPLSHHNDFPSRERTFIEALRKLQPDHKSQMNNVRCVKMHDLVRDFVLDMCSKGEHTSIVGNMSKWPTKYMRESCERISLSCTSMFEFPRNFKSPNLSLLKLMHGDESLKFPKDFYGEMNKLQVIAYDIMKYPLLSRWLDCSTNLRTLCLYRCSLMFDCSSIGNLSNLEVLSFAKCGLRKLPSTVGNLKELKLLDLTGCVDLIIDDGVLKILIKLEEIYVKVGSVSSRYRFMDGKKAIRFTDSICNELAELLKNFFALEIEFFDKNALPKNMSFKKLERFKISLGCYLDDDGPNRHSYKNTLMLVTNKFCVANGLTKLERLTISSCPVLEMLVDGERGELGVIKFQLLKFLSLGNLPELLSLCNVVNVIELPQLEELILDNLPNFTSIYPDYYESATSSMSNDISTILQPFLNKELEKLNISNMENLKKIWPCEFSSEEVNDCILREISVVGCGSVVNLFPSNPMPLLHHLEDLKVSHCGSVEVLFNIDLRCLGKNEEVGSCLRSIRVSYAENLREVCRIKGANDDGHVISGFQAIETLEINKSKRFRNVFTPTTTNFDMRALTMLRIIDCGENEKDDEMVNSRQEQEVVGIRYCDVIEEVVSNRDDEDEESGASTNTSTSLFPHLDILRLDYLPNLKLIGGAKGGSKEISSTTPIHDQSTI
ncbi:hypothetical protein L6452_08621 [Arctium lappa]|uniref:Uncharacterized protein n=1 Tax=Arctium lappa TaxID=4217 RepID=A0ACB9DI01_ARCLA|nr:hypothetical protein L6452_08621 [Arctium lappa]